MKSPEGLIWNTPSRRKVFRREPGAITQAELDQIWEEIEAEEACTECSPGPRLVLVSPERPRVESPTGLRMS